jgi:hypothetical protein
MRWVALAVAALTGLAQAAAPDLFGGGRLVAYLPLGYSPGGTWRPRAAALRADAEDLGRLGFRALVTERTGAELVPVCRFFKRHGFAAVIVGVANPTDAAELRAARALRRCADGYAVGSGGLATGRYPRAALEAATARLRRATGRPVAVREAVSSYRNDPRLLGVGDWVFPIAAADPARGAQDACGTTMQDYRDLLERAPIDRPVTLASAGLPTAGVPGANEHAQRAYLACLASRNVPFAYGEAYDQPWRGGASGARGLFRADGTPKLFAWQLARPRIAVAAAGSPGLAGRVESATPSRFAILVYTRDAGGWRAAPPAPLSRDGRWVVPAATGRPAAVFLAARGVVPAARGDRPPAVDGIQLFATASVP